MQYMCLIYDDEQVWQGMSEDERSSHTLWTTRSPGASPVRAPVAS